MNYIGGGSLSIGLTSALFTIFIFILMQEIRLLGSVPRRINFENCSELREVNIGGMEGLSGGASYLNSHGGGNDVSRAGGSSSSSGNIAKDEEMKRKLVLKGCDRLPEATKERLKACILGIGHSST